MQINNQYHVEKFCSNYASFSEADPGKCLVGCVTFLSPILRSAVGHLGVPDKSSLLQSQISLHQIHTSDIHDKKDNTILPDGIEPIIRNYNSMEVMDICVKDFGSYTTDLAIDPFWPLCMYELRGKCNNNECSWQHVRDYSCRITDYDKSNSTGMNTLVLVNLCFMVLKIVIRLSFFLVQVVKFIHHQKEENFMVLQISPSALIVCLWLHQLILSA